jgi:hypothetical protein
MYNADEAAQAEQAKSVLEALESQVRAREVEKRVNDAIERSKQHFNQQLQDAIQNRDLRLRPSMQAIYAAYNQMREHFTVLRQQRLIGNISYCTLLYLKMTFS